MDRHELLFIFDLALSLVAALAFVAFMVCSRLIGRWNRTSLEGGIKHKWVSVSIALLLCTFATFCIVVSRVVDVYGLERLPLMLGRQAASWTALLFSVWLIARALPVWRSVSSPQRTLLASSFAWSIVLLLVV